MASTVALVALESYHSVKTELWPNRGQELNCTMYDLCGHNGQLQLVTLQCSSSNFNYKHEETSISIGPDLVLSPRPRAILHVNQFNASR
jgi:hypothetical protein